MTAEDSLNFPFVESLPKKEKSKFARIWEQFEALRIVAREKGMLVPIPLAAKIIGVSRTRVDDLIEQGRLETHDVNGHRFVSEASVIAYARSERKAGRPLGDLNNLPKMAISYAKEKVARMSEKEKR
jgi:hypothetical protein